MTSEQASKKALERIKKEQQSSLSKKYELKKPNLDSALKPRTIAQIEAEKKVLQEKMNAKKKSSGLEISR